MTSYRCFLYFYVRRNTRFSTTYDQGTFVSHLFRRKEWWMRSATEFAAMEMGIEMNNGYISSVENAAGSSALDGDKSVMNIPVVGAVPEHSETLWQDAVYECCDTALWRKRLVLTPHMLLDRLKVCADLLREEPDAESLNGSDQQVARVRKEIDHLLHLLWRGGLWTNVETVEKAACDGHTYHVLAEPFTDGKPQGKPLSADAPTWLKEVLGVR